MKFFEMITHSGLAPISLSVLVASFSLLGCGSSGGTSTGNPVVAVRFASYEAASASALVQAKVQGGPLGDESVAALAVDSITMCFKRLRFKQDNTAEGEDNIDLALGEVTLSPTGTALASVVVPAGTYTRIEFDLDNDCASGESLSVANSNGDFATDDSITIRFDGTFVYTGGAVTLDLAVQQIVDALDAVASDSEIRSRAESVSGSF